MANGAAARPILWDEQALACIYPRNARHCAPWSSASPTVTKMPTTRIREEVSILGAGCPSVGDRSPGAPALRMLPCGKSMRRTPSSAPPTVAYRSHVRMIVIAYLLLHAARLAAAAAARWRVGAVDTRSRCLDRAGQARMGHYRLIESQTTVKAKLLACGCGETTWISLRSRLTACNPRFRQALLANEGVK